MSGGALIGDLIKSFAKRRLGIQAGSTWVPFDQVDYIAGAIAGTRAAIPLPPRQMALAAGSFVLLHFAVSSIGYALGIKEKAL